MTQSAQIIPMHMNVLKNYNNNIYILKPLHPKIKRKEKGKQEKEQREHLLKPNAQDQSGKGIAKKK